MNKIMRVIEVYFLMTSVVIAVGALF